MKKKEKREVKKKKSNIDDIHKKQASLAETLSESHRTLSIRQ